ncbi:MFS transporter [Chitinophaga sp. Cy-1792]|uniref:MFS transporter n=1 Tax=Chitinophaga sp. Cy-1792 TaxID=2608339 RepID=UPI00141E8606|nr:MFS transporter [Chitinophaga sp. Cy-1792]NIG55406.1 MFS transporter [Chitinophaga sp. Cy-1792]
MSDSRSKYAIPVMSFSAGTIVANVYYSQPILKQIAGSIGATETTVGKIPMLAQIGYGAGMFFLLPLGDKVNRRKLILTLATLLAVFLVLFANVSSPALLYSLALLTGICSSPAQIILPMAATLGTENRGKNVGIVFSGILCGIIGSRILSGLLTDLWGWRSVFIASAVLVIISIILLYLFLPAVAPKFSGSYTNLIASTLQLIKRYKTLRQAALLGAFCFGIFCSFWTTLTFHLSGAPYNYSSSTIGSFGIIAIGGALVAPYFGRLADRGQVFKNLYITVGLLIGSIVCMLIFPLSVPVLVGAVFFLDIGVQATQITNFTRIYALDEEAHSRLNTVYMTTYFIGAGTGTFFGLLSWTIGGWHGALLQMLLWSGIALMIVYLSKKEKL